MPYYQYPPTTKPHVDALAVSRGGAYVRAYKAIMGCSTSTLALLADYAAHGETFSIKDLIYLAVRYQVSVKFLCEWLNEATHLHREYRLFPSGIYEKAFVGSKRKDGWTIPGLLAEARAEIEAEATP